MAVQKHSPKVNPSLGRLGESSFSRDTRKVTLRVAEARTQDVGRGIARIDPSSMGKIGVELGEVVEIVGKRKTVAKIMPTYPEERGKEIVQIDGILRESAQIGLGEKIEISKTSASPAQALTLTPLTLIGSSGSDAEYFGTLLEGLPVTEGDRIRANLFGARPQDFKVLQTKPKGAVMISPETIITIKEEEGITEKKAKVSYEDIGGLGKQVARVREMIELPLRYPQVFERLGIDSPKGVFLYGPPGCGKTLLARAVANEVDCFFTHISGPEIMGKFYGESEERLRAIFEEAQRNAPAVIFIDEIDAIAPKREEMGGEKQVERRVVAQLLALMDGLESRGQVIVIGATNIPNSIDPALRRPGRFDREIAIPIPNKDGRLEILQIFTRGMPLAEDVDLDKLAQITHGFVGADLEALCREAAMTALREIMPKVGFDLTEIPYETLLKLEVTQDCFLEALKEVEPSALREVFVEVPNVRWSDVGGLKEVKAALMEAVEWPLKHEALFKKAGTRAPKGILLTGPPGTGKTLLVKALATEGKVNFISVKGPELLSRWVGESERGVREIFRKARQAAPVILFFDEIDSLVPHRGKGGGSQVTEQVISQMLTELDGIEELKGVLVLAATNREDLLDPALLRPGRFDLILELPTPDEKARLEILQIHTRGKPLGRDVDLQGLAKATERMAGSDLEFLCQKAALLAIGEFVEEAKKPQKLEDFQIGRKHFESAIGGLEVSRKDGTDVSRGEALLRSNKVLAKGEVLT